jgi:hypothetical protein
MTVVRNRFAKCNPVQPKERISAQLAYFRQFGARRFGVRNGSIAAAGNVSSGWLGA